MLVRSIRRNSFTKYLILCGIAVSFLFYIKYLNDSGSGSSGALRGSGGDVLSNNVDSAPLVAAGNGLINDRASFEKLIIRDIEKQVPKLGDNGIAVTLKGESKERGDKHLATIALNEELSEHLSYNRTTPDARNPLCREETYDLNNLPTASVVVIFYNEPYSVLLRTIHSVINTVDKKLLKEIILVDDASDNSELHGKLDYYIETRVPAGVVKMLRLKNSKIINAESNEFLSFSGYYIVVLSAYHDERHLDVVQELLTECWLLYILNVIIVTMNALDSSLPAVYTYHPFSRQSCNDTTPIDEFRSIVIRHKYELFPDKATNMYGCPVTIAAVEIPPFMILDRNDNGAYVMRGVEGSLIVELSRRLRFTPVVKVPANNSRWGTFTLVKGKAQNYSGGIGMLCKRDVAIFIGLSTMTVNNYVVFDNTPPYIQLRGGFVVPPGRPYSSFEKLFLPFDLFLWMVIISTFVIGFVVIVSLKFSNLPLYNFVVGRNNSKPFLSMVAIFLGDSPLYLPKRTFARFLTMIWLLASLVLASSYQGALFNFLHSGVSHVTCNTVDEMIDAGFTFKIPSNYLKLYKHYPRLMSRAVAFDGSYSSFWVQIRDPNVQFTFITTPDQVNYVNSFNYTQGILRINKDLFHETRVAAFLLRDSYLTGAFTERIDQFLNAGLVNFWRNEFRPLGGIDTHQIDAKEPTVMKLQHIKGCLQLCIILYLVACVVFCFEIATKRSSKLQRVVDFFSY